MNQDYIQPDSWSIIEEGFDVERVKSSESLFSIGNGAMGQRANFEEHLKSSILPKPFRVVISVESIILIRLEWAGGKMGTLNILPRY